MSKNTPTQIWGPKAWTLIHTIGLLSKQKNDVYLSNRTKNFLQNIWKILPCANCRSDAKRYLDTHNVNIINDNNKIFLFTFDFHNFVNKKTGKPNMDIQTFHKLYTDITDKNIKDINEYTEYLRKKGYGSGISEFNMKYYKEFLRFLHSYCKLLKLTIH